MSFLHNSRSADELATGFEHDCFDWFLLLLDAARTELSNGNIAGYYAHLDPSLISRALDGATTAACEKWSPVLSAATSSTIASYKSEFRRRINAMGPSSAYLQSDFIQRAANTGETWGEATASAGKAVGGIVGKVKGGLLIGGGDKPGQALGELAGEGVGYVLGQIAGRTAGAIYNATMRDKEMSQEFTDRLNHAIAWYNEQRPVIRAACHADAVRWVAAQYRLERSNPACEVKEQVINDRQLKLAAARHRGLMAFAAAICTPFLSLLVSPWFTAVGVPLTLLLAFNWLKFRARWGIRF